MIRKALLLAGALCGGAAAQAAETLLERGAYLVEAVMACDGCHTPRGPGGLLMEKRFSGGPQVWETPAYTVRGTNITPDRDTGIGAWSDAEIRRALVEGVRPDGTPLSPQMPFPFYKILTARDLDAVVAYLRSVAPVRNRVPLPVYRSAMRVELVPGALKPYTEADLRDRVKRGFYLATIAHCMECHARRPDGVHDYKNWWGKGGYVFKGPQGAVVTSNITSHKTAGIGAWSDAEIRRSLTHGVSRDGRPLRPPMDRQGFYSRMSAVDLDALVAWVRTIPPLE